jgi:hypothetical protein
MRRLNLSIGPALSMHTEIPPTYNRATDRHLLSPQAYGPSPNGRASESSFTTSARSLVQLLQSANGGQAVNWSEQFCTDVAQAGYPNFTAGSIATPGAAIPWRTVMKHAIISLLLFGGFIALSTMEASAVVCAAGVYRAGCAAVVRRPVAVVRRPVVVAPRRAVIVR